MCVDTRESEQRGAPTLLQCTARGRRASRHGRCADRGHPRRVPLIISCPGPPPAGLALLCEDACRRSAGTRRRYCEVRRTATPSRDAPTLAAAAVPDDARHHGGRASDTCRALCCPFQLPRQLVFARTVHTHPHGAVLQARWPQWLRGAGTTATARQPESCPDVGRPSAACGSLALSPLLPCEPWRPSHSLRPPARDMQILCYRSDRLGFCRRPPTPLAAACSWRLIEYP
jgi:hypothetical protein